MPTALIIPRPFTATGDRLAQLRLDANLTQREVSTALGYSSAQFISNFERGIATPPAEKLAKMFRMYGMTQGARGQLLDIMFLEERERFVAKLRVVR